MTDSLTQKRTDLRRGKPHGSLKRRKQRWSDMAGMTQVCRAAQKASNAATPSQLPEGVGKNERGSEGGRMR